MAVAIEHYLVCGNCQELVQSPINRYLTPLLTLSRRTVVSSSLVIKAGQCIQRNSSSQAPTFLHNEDH